MPDDPRAAPPIVLVAPAMAIGSRYYRPLVEELEARGWEARALTRRGFEEGQARAGRRSDWTYADEIDDIEAAVASARAERPDRPVLLLGHSLGGQLAVGHELTRTPVDGLVTVGGAVPHYRHFAFGGLHLAAFAAVVVPLATALVGHLPRPAFGGPGARSLMREWARMVLTGRTPFPAQRRITTPSLLVSLDGDRLAPREAVEQLSDFFAPGAVTRWHHGAGPVVAGVSHDHITWVRTPGPVVDRVVSWWAQQDASTVDVG